MCASACVVCADPMQIDDYFFVVWINIYDGLAERKNRLVHADDIIQLKV